MHSLSFPMLIFGSAILILALAALFRPVRLLFWAVATGLIIVGCFGSVAFAADGSTVAVSEVWSGIAPLVGDILGALFVALLTWALALLSRKWGLDVEASQRNALHSAAKTAAANLAVAIGSAMAGKTLDVKSPAVAQAIDWVLTKGAPDAARALGVTPESAAVLVTRYLAEHLGAAATTPTASPAAA